MPIRKMISKNFLIDAYWVPYGGVSFVAVPHPSPTLSMDRGIFFSKSIRIHAHHQKMISKNVLDAYWVPYGGV